MQNNFLINFGFEKKPKVENQDEQNKDQISSNNVVFIEEFPFYDYNSSSTIEYLKEYFLTAFSQRYKKYKFCKCILSLYYKNKNFFNILSKDSNKKLSEFKYDKLFLILTYTKCNCELKRYKEYMNMGKFEVIAKLKTANEKLKKLRKRQEEYDKTKQENDLLKKLDETSEDQEKNFYDIVVCINSIKCVNKEGWKVKFDEEGKKKYENNKDNGDLIVLGVLGNNNKGKSFLLSKISKIKLLSGTNINTEGLSVKYPDLHGYTQRKLILLDSAGFETPVLVKDDEHINQKEDEKINDKEIQQNKEFKENARDKIITELFLQNFIIEVSNVLLIVVGKLTYSEQLLINKIKIECKKKNKKRLFIIHNLQEFREREQVEKYIKNTLLKCSTFNLVKRTWISTQKDEDIRDAFFEQAEEKKEEDNKDKNEDVDDKKEENDSQLYDIHFTETIKYDNKDDKEKLEVYHLILANEYSNAGKVYNQYAYNFIEHVYNIIAEKKKFDIFEQVKEKFKKLSSTILNNDISKGTFTDTKNILKDKIIKLGLEENNELSLKKCFTDELGFSFFKTGDFEPKYNCFKPDKDTLEVRVEVPGNASCGINKKIEGDKTILHIYGEKKIDQTPKNPDDVFLNFREYNKFEIFIPLKVQDFEISSNKAEKKVKNGVFCFQYELAEEGEAVGAEEEGL